ncbi:MAG: RIO1 family regulatory kinase/ATPase [Nanoarchaeota archaeon]|nr:RIO1 family regulatory kinase/ATPase [Nanoarchaeota archaeon]
MAEKIIAQGAEAIISFNNNQITKNRIKKAYRLPVLDEKLRKQRTKSEAKIINKLKLIINVPKIIEVNDNKIIMQYIEGKKLSDNLDDLENKNEIAEQIGKKIAKLHDNDIIHGDLTTSNMILVEDNDKKSDELRLIAAKTTNLKSNNLKSKLMISKKINNSEAIEQEEIAKEGIKKAAEPGGEAGKENDFKVFFIDFGLGFHSSRIEDKAVDLHLIRQALEAKHFLHWKPLFEHVIKGYDSKDKDKILEQLKKVEARGRYKNH